MLHMPLVKRTGEFDSWLKGLRDGRAKAKILVRIQRLESGNPGDCAPCREGVQEMRIHYGPGYRVYFGKRGETLILLLCGGDKSSQDGDINDAVRLLNAWEK